MVVSGGDARGRVLGSLAGSDGPRPGEGRRGGLQARERGRVVGFPRRPHHDGDRRRPVVVMAFVFVYSQDPIVAHFSTLKPGMQVTITIPGDPQGSGQFTVHEQGSLFLADRGSGRGSKRRPSRRTSPGCTGCRATRVSAWRSGSIPATFAVFAVGLLAGALVNIGYAAYLLTRNRSVGRPGAEPCAAVLASSSGSVSAWPSPSWARGCCCWARSGRRSAGGWSSRCR